MAVEVVADGDPVIPEGGIERLRVGHRNPISRVRDLAHSPSRQGTWHAAGRRTLRGRRARALRRGPRASPPIAPPPPLLADSSPPPPEQSRSAEYGSIAVWSAWCWASQPFHSLWTAEVNAAVVRLGSVRLRPVRFVRSVVSHVLAMPSWRASCARSAVIIDDQAAAIAGSVGAQVGMSTLRVLVTEGLATVAVTTPSATLKFGSPPHENLAFVFAQPLDSAMRAVGCSSSSRRRCSPWSRGRASPPSAGPPGRVRRAAAGRRRCRAGAGARR